MSHDANIDCCQTNQHMDEPQICSVVFMKPSSINVESAADEKHHGVVGADDQEKKNQCRNHHPFGRRGDGGGCTFMLSVSDMFVTDK